MISKLLSFLSARLYPPANWLRYLPGLVGALLLVSWTFISSNRPLPPSTAVQSALASRFSCQIEPAQNRQLSIRFVHPGGEPVQIRIYDLIGNLIHAESVTAPGIFSQYYDLSVRRNGFYLVEVGQGPRRTVRKLSWPS